jgi:hypothetical protein
MPEVVNPMECPHCGITYLAAENLYEEHVDQCSSDNAKTTTEGGSD